MTSDRSLTDKDLETLRDEADTLYRALPDEMQQTVYEPSIYFSANAAI